MEGIEFEEDKGFQPSRVNSGSSQEKRSSLILRLLKKAGITNRSTANLILLAIAVTAFVLSFYLYTGLNKEKAPTPLTPSEVSAQLMLMRSIPSQR